jgi:hypothetical protein
MHFIASARSGWVLIALCAALSFGCQPAGDPHDADKDPRPRFSFIRAKQLIVRLDTQTGHIWFAHESGDGGFSSLGSTPDPEGRPTKSDRFAVFALNSGRGGGARGGAPPSLLRIDRATGFSWTVEVLDGAEWVAIAEPAGRVPTTPTNATRPFSSSTAGTQSPDTPEAGPSPGTKKHADDIETLHVVPRDVLANAPGTEEDNIKVVIQALEKEGLPVQIKVWAASQLGEMDPAQAVPPLLDALQSEHPEVVIAAIVSLQKTGVASTIPKILKLQQHPDPRVRATVEKVVKQVR